MKPLAIIGLIGALIVGSYTIYAIKVGRVRNQLSIDERSKSPIAFWSAIIVYLMIAGGFLGLAISETFFPL
jgi:hypothetical protein